MIDESFLNQQFDLYRSGARPDPGWKWPQQIWRWIDQRVYRDEPESLESGNIPEETRFEIVRRLSQVNDVSGYHSRFIKYLSRLFDGVIPQDSGRPVSLLDIGFGGGGLLAAIHRWGRSKGIAFDLCGLDSSRDFSLRAQSLLKEQGIPIRIITQNADNLSAVESESFDIVISSFMVHHIRSAAGIAKFSADVYRISRTGWMIADLDRRFYAPLFMELAGIWHRLSSILATDGQRSARRAYRYEEMKFILDYLHQARLAPEMNCRRLSFYPFWIIQGRKKRNPEVTAP